jgi:transcriptional regulator with XRE-family HTH domain
VDRALRQRFGARVRELRGARGLSQEALADAAEMDRTYVGGIERGERNPSLENIARVAKALSVEIADLFAGL